MENNHSPTQSRRNRVRPVRAICFSVDCAVLRDRIRLDGYNWLGVAQNACNALQMALKERQ